MDDKTHINLLQRSVTNYAKTCQEATTNLMLAHAQIEMLQEELAELKGENSTDNQEG